MTKSPSPRAPSSDRVRGQLLFDAIAGAIGWVYIVAMKYGVERSGHLVIEHLLLFAPLVIVPLGLRLSARPKMDGSHPALFAVLSYLHPLAALATVQAVLIDPGMPSGFAAAIWCAFCFVTAAWGVVRFFTAREKTLHEFAIDVGLGYLAIGGVWFTLTRLGERPLGFGH